MTKVESGRPQEAEYAPYYRRYIGKIDGTDAVAALETQLEPTLKFLRGIDESKADYRYEPGKWSVKEVIGHIIDTERVFAYRGLVFARNDKSALPGFEQDDWAQYASYSSLPLSQIIPDFEAVRRATIQMFRQFDDAAWSRTGTADNKAMSTRSTAFIIAGHLEYHLDIIRTRYLGKM